MTIQSSYQNLAAKVQTTTAATAAQMVSNQVQQTQNQNQTQYQNQMSNSVPPVNDPAMGNRINLLA